MKNIITLSGCGFSNTGTVTLIENYILSLAKADQPKICFLPTASGDAEGYIEKFYTSFKESSCITSHLSITANPDNIEDQLLSQDIIYVGGGNTVRLLNIWKEYGADTILRKAWNQGIILCGISAGAMCWFEGGISDSLGPELSEFEGGLGLLKGTYTPHCKTEEKRLAILVDSVKKGFKEGYALDDEASIHFSYSESPKVISMDPDHKAYYVNENGTVALETDYILE